MNARTDQRHVAATCTFALRMGDGRYVVDPNTTLSSYSIDNAHLWLWPLVESDEARAERIAQVVERYPGIGRAVAVRARS